MTKAGRFSILILLGNSWRAVFALAMFCVLIAMQSAQAQTLNVLYAFTDGVDGRYPGGVTFDSAGDLYGITAGPAYGGLYELMHRDSSWILQPLYNFQGGSEGYGPNGLVFGPDGALYGATSDGGGVCNNIYDYCGTVYSVRPSTHTCANALCPWSWTLEYVFGNNLNGDGGFQPRSGLMFDSAGNMYGTTYYGGLYSNGTAFQLSRTQNGWRQNALDNFPTGVGYPTSGLTFDAAGNLYGTSADSYYSRVYELVHTGQGWNEQTIYVFQGGNDGFNPEAGLIFDAAGNAYGTTMGMANGQLPGTVYQLSPQGNGTWVETVLHVFDPNTYGPASNLAMDAAGNLYGTTPGTAGNNSDHWGMVFELSPMNGSWTFTQLHHFTDGTDGGIPSGVTLDAAGNLYGTSFIGGVNGWGIVWELTP